jgi:hypothetical protein
VQNVLKFLANGNLTGPLANTGHLTQNPGAFGDTKYTHHEFDAAPQTNNEYLIKTDHQISANHRLTLSYFRYNSTVASLPGGLTSSWTYSNYAATQQNANVSDTWTISPSSVNQAWLSYTRQFGGRIPVPSSDTWATFGSDFGISGLPSRGQISDSNWFGLTQAITGPKAGANQYAVRDVFNTTRGKHSLYLGGEAGLEKTSSRLRSTTTASSLTLRLVAPAQTTPFRTSFPDLPTPLNRTLANTRMPITSTTPHLPRMTGAFCIT